MEELTERITSLESTVKTLMHIIQSQNKRTRSELKMLKNDIEIAKLEALVELAKHCENTYADHSISK